MLLTRDFTSTFDFRIFIVENHLESGKKYAYLGSPGPVYSIADECGRGTEGKSSFIISLGNVGPLFHSIKLSFFCTSLVIAYHCFFSVSTHASIHTAIFLGPPRPLYRAFEVHPSSPLKAIFTIPSFILPSFLLLLTKLNIFLLLVCSLFFVFSAD